MQQRTWWPTACAAPDDAAQVDDLEHRGELATWRVAVIVGRVLDERQAPARARQPELPAAIAREAVEWFTASRE